MRIPKCLYEIGWKLPVTEEFLTEWLPNGIYKDGVYYSLEIKHMTNGTVEVSYVDMMELATFGVGEELFSTTRKDLVIALSEAVCFLVKNDLITIYEAA
jgi:hypothetical protein